MAIEVRTVVTLVGPWMGRVTRTLESANVLTWVAVTWVHTYVEIHHSVHISFVHFAEFIPQKLKVKKTNTHIDHITCVHVLQ